MPQLQGRTRPPAAVACGHQRARADRPRLTRATEQTAALQALGHCIGCPHLCVEGTGPRWPPGPWNNGLYWVLSGGDPGPPSCWCRAQEKAEGMTTPGAQAGKRKNQDAPLSRRSPSRPHRAGPLLSAASGHPTYFEDTQGPADLAELGA